MLVDNVIDESSARYFCVVDARSIENAAAQAKKFAEDNSDEKLGIQTAIALGPTAQGNELLAEGFIDFVKDLLNSPPAWVEEPTGFNLAAPSEVFKDDIKGGLEGYKNGQKLALASSAAVAALSIAPLRKAALSIGKKTAKAVVKHPIASGATAVALSNPDIAGNAANDAKEIFSTFRSLAPYFEKICGVFKPLIDFFKSHPIYASALGAIGYGLLRTYPLWWPYMRRLGYELTSGDTLAKCVFEANGSSWTFEYGSNKNKWVLLNAGKIASPEDSISFMKTRFAQRFLKQVEKNFSTAFKNKKVILAQAALTGNEKIEDAIRSFLDDENAIKANMFNQKMMFEADDVDECDGAAAGGDVGGAAVGGGEAGISSSDVLGSCDHANTGFLGPGCFHVPSKCAVPFHRWEICNGGSKRKKTKKGKIKRTPYEKNMKVVYSMFEDDKKRGI